MISKQDTALWAFDAVHNSYLMQNRRTEIDWGPIVFRLLKSEWWIRIRNGFSWSPIRQIHPFSYLQLRTVKTWPFYITSATWTRSMWLHLRTKTTLNASRPVCWRRTCWLFIRWSELKRLATFRPPRTIGADQSLRLETVATKFIELFKSAHISFFHIIWSFPFEKADKTYFTNHFCSQNMWKDSRKCGSWLNWRMQAVEMKITNQVLCLDYFGISVGLAEFESTVFSSSLAANSVGCWSMGRHARTRRLRRFVPTLHRRTTDRKSVV